MAAPVALAVVALGAAAVGACGDDDGAASTCAGAGCGGMGTTSSTGTGGGAGGGEYVENPWQDVDVPEPVCGDGVCSADEGETCVSCPSECGACPPGCGDIACDPGETCVSCPADCGGCPPGCGDGACDAAESCLACPIDCGACAPGCGDGTCDAGETCGDCALDCGDCPPSCGDGACDPGETCVGCAADCGACPPGCGNGVCDGDDSCATCPADCGECAPTCGDGACNGDELCQTCEADCGGCADDGGKNVKKTALPKCAFQAKESPAGARDITFVAFGDPHVVDGAPGCPGGWPARKDHAAIRDAINSAASHTWPDGKGLAQQGKPFDDLRGAIIAGDLTDSGDASIPAGEATCRQLDRFFAEFGRCGDEGKLSIPVYTLYGNHDFPFRKKPKLDPQPVVAGLSEITKHHRPGKTKDLIDDAKGGTGHYAWRWDDIWFVNLDVKPGFKIETITKDALPSNPKRKIDPHGSTRFLRHFLEQLKDDPSRQIVIVAHYPLGSHRLHDAEREKFCNIIDDAQHGTGSFKGKKLAAKWPVIAYVHGHTHSPPEFHEFECKAPHGSITIPQFSAGTPQWTSKDAGAHAGDLRIDFTIFHIGKGRLEAVGTRAHAEDPTGEWTTLHAWGRDYPIAPDANPGNP
jgi:hypothetical protein